MNRIARELRDAVWQVIPARDVVPGDIIRVRSGDIITADVQVSMAVGSAELAKRGVLVTRFSAAEDAATMDVLCVDETGTITMNQLAVTGLIPLDQYKESDVLFVRCFGFTGG